MAGNDTAALVVALSAQLTKFERDMKGAVDIADKRTKEIETRFTKMNAEISGKLSSMAQGAAGNIGFLGSLLSSIGPAGLAAAVVLGTVAGAVTFLTDKTLAFAEKSKALVESSETIGLSISAMKTLGKAGQMVGIDFDSTTSAFTQFILRLREMQKTAAGPLYEALLAVDKGLLDQLMVTKDSAAAIELLIKGYARLTEAGKKLELSKGSFGKGGLQEGRALTKLDEAGGLAAMEASRPKVDEAQIQRAAEKWKEINKLANETNSVWGAMFSDTILDKMIFVAQKWKDFAEVMKYAVDAMRDSDKFLNAPINNPPVNGAESLSEGRPRALITVTPKPERNPAGELADLTRQIGFLEGAVTPVEALTKKMLELEVAEKKGELAAGTHARAVAAFTLVARVANLAALEKFGIATQQDAIDRKNAALAQEAITRGLTANQVTRARIVILQEEMVAANAAREKYGIASEQQIIESKLFQLQQDRMRLTLSENDAQRATVIILREAKQAAEALEVRASYLPGLKQLEIDARNTRKAMDEFAVGGLNSVGDGIADVISRTKSLSDAFRDMANSIIRDLTRMIVKQALLGPIAGAIGGLLGGSGASAFTGSAVTAAGANTLAFGGPRAGGGPTTPGNAYLIGEKGPELWVPGAAGMVVPNDAMARGGGGGNHTFNINLSLAGANGDEAVARIASAQAARAARMVLSQVPGLVVKTQAQAWRTA